MTRKFFRALGLCVFTVFCFNQINLAYTILANDQELSNLDSWWAQAVQNDAQQAAADAAITQGSRNAGVAIGLATFPGVLVHGSGHFYAGRPLTGALLLMVEAGAVYMTYRGVSDLMSVADANMGDDVTDIQIITNLSETGQLSRGIGLAAGGLVLFLSSWLYDLTGSPIAVEQENKKEVQEKGPKVSARLTLTGFEVEFDRLF